MAGNDFDPLDEQIAVPCVLMRGGTSKALFFHESAIPPAGAARDAFLKRAMGTPDQLQIDGLGGLRLVTSKVAIISKSTRPGADVDYLFAQIDVERDIVGYDGNCGNISSAVGPFAIDEGLVDATEPVTSVRIYNVNTDKMLVAKVQVVGGKARVLGDCSISGVPGTGAKILMDYAGTVGAKTGKLLPSGQVTDTITLEDGRRIEVTICDVANPCVFFSAESLGLTGSELPAQISGDTALIETIGEIQGKAGQLIGMWPEWRAYHLPGLPLAVMVAPAETFVDVNGETVLDNSMDLRARLVFLGKCHDSMAGTGSMCTAAASRIQGSKVRQAITSSRAAEPTLRIGHPLGVMEVKVVVESDADGDSAMPRFAALGLTRTARRLMAGEVYVPRQHPAD
ncbi:2-methylaconitate cis-trans isomerase PrpF family protein [Variovorax sp. LG9.2]|uniref:2-methylaconitate cis-trans isomerase PrpF family protein n=1 Tax=Variovorax sp. LG9.2 TaxID=3048626 RepID=UPI002B226E4D|nr:PrpF domain-containing protein [Variovorax sp. LG9.2]MEB0060126.1 PrpF domain-containing protein [Variovorax sp. LG9.2]